MKADRTPDTENAAEKIRQLRSELSLAQQVYKDAVASSYAATGDIHVGDVIMHRGTRAQVSSIRAEVYYDGCPPQVRLYIRKELKNGAFGTRELEVYFDGDIKKCA